MKTKITPDQMYGKAVDRTNAYLLTVGIVTIFTITSALYWHKLETPNPIKVIQANPTETIKVIEANDNRTISLSSVFNPINALQGNFSAYTASADECGKSDGITASGKKVTPNHTLACPPQYKFGTKIMIEGVGIRTCWDRGGAIKGNKFDLYVETKAEARQFGRRNLNYSITN